MSKDDTTPRTLAERRREIDRQDNLMLAALAERVALTAEIANAKHDGVIFRPGREADILNRLLEESKGAIDPRLVESIWRQVIAFSLAGQKPLTIAHLAGTDMAISARYRFGVAAHYKAKRQAADVFDMVASGEADLGVLPHWEAYARRDARRGDAPAYEWWRDLAARRREGSVLAVAAITPLTPMRGVPASVVVARHMPDESQFDITLCYEEGRLITYPGHHPEREDALGIFQQPRFSAIKES